MTRHPERVERLDLLLDASAVDADTAADQTGLTADTLIEAAEAGRLPPWLAELCPHRGWLFHRDLSAKIVESQTRTGLVWVPALAAPEAALTAEWVTERPSSHRRALLSWLRFAAPDPLEADTEMWMWWCSHSPDSLGYPPAPELVAVRWQVTYDWYELLTVSGIGHSAPHLRTEVTVAHVVETPDTDTAASDPAGGTED